MRTTTSGHTAVLRWGGLAVGAALSLAACSGGTGAGSADGGGDSGGDKATTIKLVAAEYSKDNTKAFWDKFAGDYKAKTGNTLEVQIVSWDDIDQQSSTMIQNNNPPDILNLNAYASYAKDGLLYSADEVLPEAAKADLLEAFVKSGTYEGKLYGMPDLSSARAMFYNKALFKEAGIAEPPKTWAEFEEAAKKVAGLGKGTIGYGLPLGPEEAQGEFSIWTVNNGGDWKKDGKWTINSPENLETLTFLKGLSDKKLTQNNPGKTNRQDAFDLFASGKVGMVVGFSPLAGALDEAKKVEYGVAPMPTKAEGGEPQTFGVTDYLMAFKKKGNQDAVRAFYDLYYQKDQVNAFIKAEGFLPVTKSGIEVFSGDPKLKTYLDTLPNAHLTPTDDPKWDTVKLAVQQNLGTAITGDPKAVLDKLQQSAEAGS